MGRKRIPLEAFDPTTLWPIQVFDSFTALAEAGHVRKSVHRCLAGEAQQHHGYGWRHADGASYTDWFLREMTREFPECHNDDRIKVDEMTTEFAEWVRGESVMYGKHLEMPNIHRFREIISRKYTICEAIFSQKPCPYSKDGVSTVRGDVVSGLVWRDPGQIRENIAARMRELSRKMARR
ncbi:hypothetical protein C5Y96_17745 [Blastopirellula marina]|uniref:Uncharacterized protein n=1 Tax=Blastopirellula marina TaxID=124 RepID=A0A2S8F622_9BACT|nr:MULTISPECIES: hypothetical protein [Pirellulaceae]PQO27384.1 hypothetical protein C5Y96_17745 [Blastopirellula marina]RCS47921.1 hypothetical protein DTL36_17770 [Bremerella cremea]